MRGFYPKSGDFDTSNLRECKASAYETPLSRIQKNAAFDKVSATEHQIPGTNLYISGFSMDRNGNSIVYVNTPNERRKAFQTNGYMPQTHNAVREGMAFFDSADSDKIAKVEQEVLKKVQEDGGPAMKGKLKVTESKKTATGTEGKYKSDEDIAAEFNDMKVDEFKVVDRDPSRQSPGKDIMISLEFPEGDESVGGGSTHTTEWFVAKPASNGKWEVMFTLQNWYPKPIADKIVSEVMDRFEEEVGSPLVVYSSKKTASEWSGLFHEIPKEVKEQSNMFELEAEFIYEKDPVKKEEIKQQLISIYDKTNYPKNKWVFKTAAIYDGYGYRVTIEAKAGDFNESYTPIVDMLSAADFRYREVKRYTVDPNRVLMDILVTKSDVELIQELNKRAEETGITFTFNDNISEAIKPKVITTEEKELGKDKPKTATKKTAAMGFVDVSVYVDDERLSIGDENYVKMTDDLEETIADLEAAYPGAEIDVKEYGNDAMINITTKKKKK